MESFVIIQTLGWASLAFLGVPILGTAALYGIRSARRLYRYVVQFESYRR